MPPGGSLYGGRVVNKRGYTANRTAENLPSTGSTNSGIYGVTRRAVSRNGDARDRGPGGSIFSSSSSRRSGGSVSRSGFTRSGSGAASGASSGSSGSRRSSGAKAKPKGGGS